MPKYDIGDVVKIREDLEGDIDYAFDCYCVPNKMTRYRGRTATITHIEEVINEDEDFDLSEDNAYYRLDIDDGEWSWVWNMFDEGVWYPEDEITADVSEDDLVSFLLS